MSAPAPPTYSMWPSWRPTRHPGVPGLDDVRTRLLKIGARPLTPSEAEALASRVLDSVVRSASLVLGRRDARDPSEAGASPFLVLDRARLVPPARVLAAGADGSRTRFACSSVGGDRLALALPLVYERQRVSPIAHVVGGSITVSSSCPR